MSHPTQPDAERAHNAVLRAESEQPLVRLNQPMAAARHAATFDDLPTL
jgi:hypothetical protein